MQNRMFILFGFLFLYLINLSLAGSVIFLYLKTIKKSKQYDGNIISNASLLAFVGVILNSISLMLFPFQIIVFTVASYFLLGIGFFIVLFKLKKFEKRDAIILSGVLALVLNPAWLNLLQGVAQ